MSPSLNSHSDVHPLDQVEIQLRSNICRRHGDLPASHWCKLKDELSGPQEEERPMTGKRDMPEETGAKMR